MSIVENLLFQGLNAGDILRSALDILIVYYLVYRTLLVFKGTRAMQMLVGMAVVLAGYGGIKFLGLVASNWMFDQILGSLLIVMVIIFQQDIRRALSRLGRQPLSTLVTSVEEVKMIDEMVKAVAHFSGNQVGALMVIEREGDLSDYVEGATRLDARVTSELLVTVFNTATPLHDGAVLIQNGRMAFAGVFLPLSSNPRLARELGTRHRAAIGISEETDAIVVVVSEETGKISLCMGGRITRDLDPETLRKVLLNLVGGAAVEKQKKAGKPERSRVKTQSLSVPPAAAAPPAAPPADAAAAPGGVDGSAAAENPGGPGATTPGA